MRKNFFIIFNGKMNTEVGVSVVSRPAIPGAVRDYEEVNVDGRDGTLYEDLGTYSDINIKIQFNFMESPDSWNERFRRIRSWLLVPQDSGQESKLVMSDDRAYFYKVKKVEITSSERSIKRIGRFEVTFTCEAFQYEEAGQQIVDAAADMINLGYTARPVWYLYGTGTAKLVVNGNTMIADVNQVLTIDTELGLTYNTFSGEMQNTAISGDYEDMYLQPGHNTIGCSDGFEVMLKPNWRFL